MTQKQIAEVIGVHQSQVSRILSGESSPRKNVVVKLIKAGFVPSISPKTGQTIFKQKKKARRCS